MSGGSKRDRGFTLVAPNLNHPEMIVVAAPPPPNSITWLPFLGVTSHKLRVRVRGLSRNEYVLPGTSKKQSPPASGTVAECPRRWVSSCLWQGMNPGVGSGCQIQPPPPEFGVLSLSSQIRFRIRPTTPVRPSPARGCGWYREKECPDR